MAHEQQPGDYNLPQMSTSSKEQKSWTPQLAIPELGHKECKTLSLCNKDG